MRSIFSRERILLAAICLLGAAVGHTLRDERPAEVVAHLTGANELAKQTLLKHQQLILQHQSGALSQRDLAAALERETLPQWRECVQRAGVCRDMGAKGEVFEDLAAHFSLRLNASESLVAAVKQQDPKIAEVAKQQWAEAEKLSASLNVLRREAFGPTAPTSAP